MKKIMTLALSLILVLSLSACSVRFEVRNKNNSKSNKTYEVKDINKNVKLENENKIDISIGFGKINIVGYDGNEVIVTGKTNLNVDEINININKEGNSIEISDGNDLSNIDLFKSNNIDVKLMIKIPNNYSGDINLSYGAAEVELSNIDCNNLNIDGGAGELTINDIFFNKLDFNAGVGGNLIYEGGVGSAKIKIPENSPVYFNTDSGIGETNINAITSSERTYEFNLSLGIGEIKVYN